MPPREHRRRDEDGVGYHERATDNDKIAQVGNFLERYKILWAVVIAVLTWWGREVTSPLREASLTMAQVRLINAKIDNVIIPRLDSGEKDRTRMIRTQEQQGEILGYLTRMACLDLNPVERTKAAINCRDIPIIKASPPPPTGASP